MYNVIELSRLKIKPAGCKLKNNSQYILKDIIKLNEYRKIITEIGNFVFKVNSFFLFKTTGILFRLEPQKQCDI